MSQTIKNIAVIGGTHGNEVTGIHLLDYWRVHPEGITHRSLNVELHQGNPQANRLMKRYVDQDLNRQFALAALRNPDLTGLELTRARELDALLGPKEDPRIDFVIDLHTTTANMGVTLVIGETTPLVLDLLFYIKQQMPEVVLFLESRVREDDVFLTSLGRHNGLLIEVGPTPQGLLRADVFDSMRRATEHAVQFMHLHNTGAVPELPESYPAFEFIENRSLPVNDKGELWGMVHPQAQDGDYNPVKPGDPLFLTFDGEVISYEGEDTVYLSFVNEAAYYDRLVGLALMRKVVLNRKEPAHPAILGARVQC